MLSGELHAPIVCSDTFLEVGQYTELELMRVLIDNAYPEAVSNKEVGVEDRDDGLCSRHQVETARHTVAHANLDPSHQQVILNVCS